MRANRPPRAAEERAAVQRLLPLLVPVATLGVVVLALAALELALDPPGWEGWVGIAALIGTGLLAEMSPVPIQNLPVGHVSLGAVFFVGAGVLYGPAEAAIVAAAVRVGADLLTHKQRERLVYNLGAFAVGAAAAGGVAQAIGDADVGELVLSVVAAAAVYYVVNVVLVSAAIGRWTAAAFVPLLRTTAATTVIPFGIMASGALMLVVLWERSPLLTLALVGPLLAVALYQRSVHDAIVATQLALTDPLTALGNPRHFNERLQNELDAAERGRFPLALCLLDVDGLKHVNDTQGHQAGDRLLQNVAASLRQGGEAFRVGGDEFALLLPGLDETRAKKVGESVLERVRELDVGISCGLAVFPTGVPRNDLYRAADDALYESKRGGTNEVVVFRPPSAGEVRSIPARPTS